MAASNKRTRSLESLDMPGGFPERRKPNKRRADINGGLIGGSGEWLLSCVAATVSYAKSWFSSTPAKTEIRHSGDSTHTQSAAVKERIEGSQPRVRSRKSKKQKRRKALVGHEYSQGSLQSKSRRLVKEYTTPSSVWSVRDSPARALEHPTRKFSGAYSGNGFYSARSPAYSEGVSAWSQVSTEERQEDTRSILSIDSSVPDNNEYRYTFGEQRSNASARRFTFESSVSPSPFSSAAATPVKGRWTSSSASGAKRSEPADLWMAQLRKKIQETLSVTSPASRIATPAYDRVCREQNDFEARLAQAKQKMAFALPANAKTVIAQTQLPGFTAEINNVPVTARDVDTLGDGKWLNDEVINFYMQLIMERSEQTPGMPTVHAFNTFFYSTLRDQGYVRVKRWTRRVKLFEKDLVIVPVHLGVHWCCAVIDLRAKTIVYYDALLGDNHECLQLLMDYLRQESLDKLSVALDESGWSMRCEKQIPRQMNGYDCGVFAITFAEYASRDAPFAFSQANCSSLRRRVTYEIATKSLMTAVV